MATRGCIARMTPEGFRGVYHHWDSYPDGLGSQLLHLLAVRFRGDVGGMLRFLIDDHPSGWSTVCADDIDAEPGFGREGAMRCYCHGERSDPPRSLDQDSARRARCEFVYAFTGDAMHVMQPHGDGWKVVAKVDLRTEMQTSANAA